MNDFSGASWIVPEWPAPSTVCAISTTRYGGVSLGPYASFNLGTHVHDDPVAVAENRHRLKVLAGLPADPLWLSQVHGIRVVDAAEAMPGVEADAAFTGQTQVVCAIQTADCLPVLFCDTGGKVVAAAHAGWRGLLAGVLENTIEAMTRRAVPTDQIMAWLGPAIGPQAFEVGEEVRAAFLSREPAAESAFVPISQGESQEKSQGKYLADLFFLARKRLLAKGVSSVYGGEVCTVSDPARFFSHRRDRISGRQASLIWLTGTITGTASR